MQASRIEQLLYGNKWLFVKVVVTNRFLFWFILKIPILSLKCTLKQSQKNPRLQVSWEEQIRTVCLALIKSLAEINGAFMARESLAVVSSATWVLLSCTDSFT